MRRIALTLTLPALVAGLACTSHAPPPEPRPEAASAGRLAIGDELAGQALASASDGPWQIRTTRGGAAGGPAERAYGASKDAHLGAGKLEAEGRLSFDSGVAFEGGEVPPDSRAPGDPPPVPVTSPAPEPAASEVIGVGGGAGGAFAGRAGSRGDDDGAAPRPAAKPSGDVFLAEAEKSFEPGGAAPVQQLKAGATDDNADYDAFLEFLATWVDRKEIRELYQPMDVSDRHFVRVVDVDGRPVPGAVVSIVDEAADRVLWTGTTYGDGRIPYYPNLGGAPAVGAGGPLLIEAYVEDADGTPRGVRAPWDGLGRDLQVRLSETCALPEPIALDVCFVIDTTGSMGDEIESIKASLLKVTEQLRSLDREFDLRYAAVLYKDVGDDYVTATHPFTEDIEAFDGALRAVGAGGGGDGPESLNQAVAQAVDGVAWREGAAKVAFLIADAPPHMDYAGDVPYGEGARAALARGIRIHSVAASGLDPVGTLVFRQIAQLTRGKFIFIEYGSPEASAESHGVAGEVKRDNLEDILFEQIRDEVARYGR